MRHYSRVPGPTRHPVGISALVALASLIAACVPVWFALQEHWTGALFAGALSYAAFLVAAAVLAHGRSRGAQLLARSIWWSAFGAGALVALFAANSHEVSRPGLVVVLATSTALLATARRGLGDGAGDERAPVAYPRAIMVSMIMALADAQALGWIGGIMVYASVRHHGNPGDLAHACAMLSCAGVALCALFGLYRLRMWGLVLSAIATLAIGVLALTPVFGLHDAGPIPYAFALSAAVQLALLAPLFLAIIRRRAPSSPSPRVQRLASAVPVVVIVAIAALSVITVATSHSLIRF